MTLDQLEVFELVAQLGSFSKAAKSGDLAQSLISRKLAQLETEWGDQLFHRTGRGVVLTEFGQRIQPHVQLLLAQSQRLRDEVKDAAGVPVGSVHIGLLPSMSCQLVTELFGRVKALAPAVKLHTTEGFSGQLDEQIAAGKLDIAVVNRYGIGQHPGDEMLGTAGTFLVGAPCRLLDSETVQFRELDGLPLVLPTVPNGLRTMLDQVARQKGIRLDVALEVDTLSAMKSVAMSGQAFTILPFLAVSQEVANGRMQAARLSDPELPRTISLCVTRQRPLTRAGRFVLSQIRELVPHLLKAEPDGS